MHYPKERIKYLAIRVFKTYTSLIIRAFLGKIREINSCRNLTKKKLFLQVRVYNLIHSIDESANENEENIIGNHILSDTANRNVLEPAFKAMLQTMARNEETTNAIS